MKKKYVIAVEKLMGIKVHLHSHGPSIVEYEYAKFTRRKGRGVESRLYSLSPDSKRRTINLMGDMAGGKIKRPHPAPRNENTTPTSGGGGGEGGR
jgi:hypothetical protein